MSAVEWKVGDRGKVGVATFAVQAVDRPGLTPYLGHNPYPGILIRLDNDDPFRRVQYDIDASLLAAMGAVRIPVVPPTIGTPQSVRDNPPPRNTRVLAWTDGYEWISVDSAYMAFVDWWMPQPAPPPGVTP